jgi:DNA-directed DNA polymerase III PolC
MYINCHSNFSLRYGTIPVKDLVAMAKANGLDALALTDINCMTGIYEFTLECLNQGIKPIVGIEFRNGDELLFVALVKEVKGLKELNDWLSYHHVNHKKIPNRAPDFDFCFVIYPLENQPKQLRENEFIGIRIDQVNKLYSQRFQPLLKKAVILQPVTIRTSTEFELHRALRAMDHNIVHDKLQNHMQCSPTEHMVAMDQLLAKYERYPSIAENTMKLLDACSFDFDFKSPKNKKCYTETQYEDKLMLTRLAEEGMIQRFGPDNEEAKRRIAKELDIIDRLCFGGYFLITWDVIQFSKRSGFYHVGRGSGANSVVAYCLGITDVDPIELDLYFERFLNPSRTSPPDFDIDWSHKTRNDILDYIFNRFGSNHAAFCGTVGTFRYRSPIRELGKVYGLPKEEIDTLTRRPENYRDRSDIVLKIQHLSLMLQGFPNLRSMHSCGIIISEEPITSYVALDIYPKGYTTVQIDMYTAEDIGFEKLDVLSQRGLSSIDSCLKIIAENRGEEANIHRVEEFKVDPKVNENLAKGRTLGCFYIESPAMRGLLRRLKCDNYNTLVAASSVIRPGVAKSGMMREYIKRHNDPKSVKYLHPVFEKHLGETYGVMVYQEDVIKIAHHFAGLDLADADTLRRAMSGKTRSQQEFDRVKDNFFTNCDAMGHPRSLSDEVYRQILSFAGYSFCKAHSASYSVESYQSLYLKTYYPVEFIVGVINNFGGFYRTEVYVHEARMTGGTVHAPCINTSKHETILIGTDIYLGFQHLHNFDERLSNRIIDSRKQFGVFKNAEDFIHRTGIGYDLMKTLIYVGALRFTELTKAELIVKSKLLLAKNKAAKPMNRLFDTPTTTFKLPSLRRTALEDAFDEIELLGFSVSLSAFDLLDVPFPTKNTVDEFWPNEGKKVQIVGFLISIKSVPTAKGHMNFGTWVDVEGNYYDSAHFPKQLLQHPFQGPGCYVLTGKVVIDFHFPTLEISHMQHLKMKSDPRYDEREFRAELPKTQELAGTPLPRAPYPTRSETAVLFGGE